MDKYQQLKNIISKSNSIVVFTGAGISVPSGIPDFRSADGLYNQKTKNQIPPEEIVSHSFFYSHTKEFYDFYLNKMLYPNAKPNLAHQYFANLEKKGKNITIVTQNIDNLHQEAGSTRVYELHGSVKRNYCDICNKFFNDAYLLQSKDKIPMCDKCGGLIKPDVVLYEEGLDDNVVNLAINAIMTCDTMIIIGTSLSVYPAASFVRYFKGNNLIVINKQKTSYDTFCNLVFNEDVIEVIKNILDRKVI